VTLPLSKLKKLIRDSLREDASLHDVTTLALVPKNLKAKAVLLAKSDLIICGMPLVEQAFRALDPRVKLRFRFKEGEKVKKGQVIAELSGKAQALLSAERVALNFLQHLSGIATLTRQYVDAVRGTKVKIRDTRKTTPGLRLLERYAVKIGGGVNHRFDLRSAVMVKDNHVVIAGSIQNAWQRLGKLSKKVPVILEAKDFRQLEAALTCGARYIQLDNMSLRQLKEAVKRAGGQCRLEATGGVNLRTVRAIAKTGVDYISVGAITHSAPAVDISLEILVES
jgi:nicotinate-nucleotide pyrophosphorylase (carboxylating)